MKKLHILYSILTTIILIDYTTYSLAIEDTPHIIKLAIMGTNDLHGTAFPKSLYRKDNQ
jgi:2',3'-cyclic-nucleotide 2'-phosphodiesterase (5'-nucleotidase family)